MIVTDSMSISFRDRPRLLDRLKLLGHPSATRPIASEILSAEITHSSAPNILEMALLVARVRSPNEWQPIETQSVRAKALFAILFATLDFTQTMEGKTVNDPIVQGMLDIERMSILEIGFACALRLRKEKLIPVELYDWLIESLKAELHGKGAEWRDSKRRQQ